MMMLHPNLFAFLFLIRTAEGTADREGYSRLFGGKQFGSFADHPRQKVTCRLGKSTITSTAAGAYQLLAGTWDECRQALTLPDFSPESQDRAAIFLLRRRDALQDVLAGRLYMALEKCNHEWASLPGSPYGQPTISLDKALAAFTQAGGTNTEEKPHG